MRSTLQKLVQILDGTPAEYGERENGQSVVELALVMPILLILLVGMIEIGWFTNNYLILLEASRVGSREGTKLGGDSSPYTWEQGTITLQVDDPTTEDVDEGRDLNSIVGVAAPAFLSEQRDTFTGGPEVRSPNAAPLAADPPVDDAQRVEGALARGAGTPDELACERLRIGFYTNVACATLDSMAPLDQSVTFIPNDELTFPGENDLPLPLNDIIVSVFSINRIPALVGGSPSIEEQRANQFAGPFRTVTQTGVANHNSIHGGTLSEIDYTGVPGQAPRDAGNNPNPAAAQVMVTGRFPANANECESDWRDPFDLDNNGAFNAWEIDDERLNILNNGGILMDSVDEDFYNITGVGNSPEALRGFALTGKWRAANSENCMGSEWDIIRMERLVNLRTGEPTEQEVLELPERQGLVLVEVFWRHDLLIDFPLSGGMLQMFGAGTANRDGINNDTGENYIKVWAAFPIATVNFNLDPGQECSELLFLEGIDDTEYATSSPNSILDCTAPST